jgi:hypothetical protein
LDLFHHPLYFLALISTNGQTWLICLPSKKLPVLYKKNSQDIAKLKKKEIPWEAGLKASQWPLIASPRQLIPRIKNEQALRKLYPVDSLATLLANRANAGPNKSQP